MQKRYQIPPLSPEVLPPIKSPRRQQRVWSLQLAHASVFVQNGIDVVVLIDEQDGRQRARLEQDRLARTGAPGALVLWSTRQVLKQADPAWLADGLSWEQVYNRMRPFDAGLAPLASRT